MSDLTVNPKIRVDAREHDIVISTEQAIVILCRDCGNIRTISLHEHPTQSQMEPGGRLHAGTTPQSGFGLCECNAPYPGGVLRDVKSMLRTCNTIEELERMLDVWIINADRGKKKL